MGVQSPSTLASHQYGPLQALVNKQVVYKGVQHNPSHTHGYALFTCCAFVRQNTIKLFFSSNEIYCQKGRHQYRNYCETRQLITGNSVLLRCWYRLISPTVIC